MNNNKLPPSRAHRFFQGLLNWRWPIIIIGTIAVVLAGSMLPRLTKDTGADAFIDPQNPALIYRDKVKEIFGLQDPIVISVSNSGTDGVYNTDTLALVEWLSEEISRIENIDPDRVTSLTSENNIVGTYDGMLVEPFLGDAGEAFSSPPGTPARSREIRAAIEDFPLYRGSLVSEDGSTTLVVAELLDDDLSQATYRSVQALIEKAPKSEQDQLYVAGEGAIAGYLSTYIDRDARRLNPLAGVIITLVLVLAFVSVRGALLPNLVVMATAVGTFGVMAFSGVSFYVITNGLVVNLIGIAVADSIHIFSQYYEELREHPEDSQRELVTRAIAEIWRPITLTTLTTAAGFLALAASAEMPPVRFFGLFGALGLAIAWIYSLTYLPALMSLLPKRLSRPFKDRASKSAPALGAPDLSSRLLTAFGRKVIGQPRMVLGVSALLVLVGIIGINRLVINDSRIENFQPSEPIYQADKLINRTMDGIYHLDVMVEGEQRDALHDPQVLQRIEALQQFLEGLPHIGGTTSIVDYIKQMNKAVNENRDDAYQIPNDPMLVSQLFLLYSASGDPTDLEEEIDHEHQRALVRANLDRSTFINNQQVIPALQEYLDTHFNNGELTATITGRVKVDYEWIGGIASNHLLSVTLTFAAVMLVASLMFRSLVAGILVSLPVGLAIMVVYATMGFGGIWLGVGTSMFAAIAIGLGVDFAIHTLDRIRANIDRNGFSDEALLQVFPTTGRALFFNFLSVSLGFGILMTSDVPPLVHFGTLVTIAVSTAFIASMTLLPALIKLWQPAFLRGDAQTGSGFQPSTGVSALALIGLLVMATAQSPARAAELPSAEEIMKKVHERDEGKCVTRDLELSLTARSGATRKQETRGFRCYFGQEKRSVIFYTGPANIEGTAFLTYDYPESEKDDDQWLYLPALRKVRRISSSNRGDYFLGTDLTYEEIKKENKVELNDYHFTALGTEEVAGKQTLLVEGKPVDQDTAKELGYGRVLWRIDPEIWLPLKVEFWDLNDNPLKVVHNREIQEVDGVWTATEIHAENHKTGHSTLMRFSNIDYKTPVRDYRFEQRMLRRGL